MYRTQLDVPLQQPCKVFCGSVFSAASYGMFSRWPQRALPVHVSTLHRQPSMSQRCIRCIYTLLSFFSGFSHCRRMVGRAYSRIGREGRFLGLSGVRRLEITTQRGASWSALLTKYYLGDGKSRRVRWVGHVARIGTSRMQDIGRKAGKTRFGKFRPGDIKVYLWEIG